MPDLERFFDEMRVDLAGTPEEKSYWRGYVEGKKVARVEVAITFGVILGLVVLILAMARNAN
jgi:hypothetical protein